MRNTSEGWSVFTQQKKNIIRRFQKNGSMDQNHKLTGKIFFCIKMVYYHCFSLSSTLTDSTGSGFLSENGTKSHYF
jgi:hypothetical protein